MERAELSDETLMGRVAGDDIAAFDTLLLRHQATVYRFSLRLTGDTTLAEDLTQETFLRVWRARRGYRPTAAFQTWLLTIARHLALDEAKRRRVPTERLIEGRASDDVAQAVTARALEHALEDAIACLPTDLREVVLLRDMSGLQYDEIAQVIGCPVGTVKSRLNAARTRLRAVVWPWIEGE